MTASKIAIVWRGDREARRNATPANDRFHRVFEELAALRIHAQLAVYDEEFADELRAQLLQADGVLVWVNPLQDGVRTREALDPLLREVAESRPVPRADRRRPPHDWPVRPVAEVFYDRTIATSQTRSALLGATWQVKDDVAIDIAIRGARINEHTAGQIRGGITLAFSASR